MLGLFHRNMDIRAVEMMDVGMVQMLALQKLADDLQDPPPTFFLDQDNIDARLLDMGSRRNVDAAAEVRVVGGGEQINIFKSLNGFAGFKGSGKGGLMKEDGH